MAVFRSPKTKTESAPAIHSLLGKDVTFTGELHTGTRSLRIEGVVDGVIHSEGEVSIALGGLAKGTIFAKHLVVTGRAEGTMKITDCLEIHGTGYVEGDVEVGSLVVDEGGTLQGVCVRKDQPAKAVQAEPALKAAAGVTPPQSHPRINELKKI